MIFAVEERKMAKTYMTVRELIEKLLDCRMSARVTLFTPDPERPDCRGVGFDINEVVFCGGEAEIRFTDWRDEVDERKARVNEN
jgi:hypothetical protein